MGRNPWTGKAFLHEVLTRQKPNSIRLGISPDSVNNI